MYNFNIRSVSISSTMHSLRRFFSIISVKSDHILYFFIIFLIFFRLWLVQIFELMATETPHDDFLFITLAKHILSGNWLGPYNQMTLIKGPVYPLFIALSHYLGLPVLLSQQLLYTMACIFTAIACKPIIKNKVILATCFIFLLYNPFLYNYPLPGRVLREGFSISLVLIVFSALIGWLIQIVNDKTKAIFWSICFGLSFSSLWYTREEGIWMIPGVIITLIGGIYLFIYYNNGNKYKFVISILSPILIFITISFIICNINKQYYGKFLINELKSKEFISAYGGLMNIKQNKFTRFVPVSDDVLSSVFLSSSSAREIQQFYNEEVSSSARFQWPPSFFIWRLRDLVAKSGHATSLTESLNFYDKFGKELESACKNGLLNCLDRKPSLQPPWHGAYNKSFFPELISIIKRSITFTDIQLDMESQFKYWHSTSRTNVLLDYSYVVHDRILPSVDIVIYKQPKFYKNIKAYKVGILQSIGNFYKISTPVLFSIAILINLIIFIKLIKQKQYIFQVFIGFLILSCIISLASILTFVSITLWPVARPLYSIYPLVLLYAVLMISCFKSDAQLSRHYKCT